MVDGLFQFEDFRYLVEKDIRNMVLDEFGKHLIAQGRIVFGLGRTKKLTGVMHWVQDCFRANNVPNHADFNEPALYVEMYNTPRCYNFLNTTYTVLQIK